MPAWRRILDRWRPELNRVSDERRSAAAGAGGGDAVRLAVDGGARDRRPADGVEARVMEAEDVALAHADVLVAVELNVDVPQLRRTNERLRDERVRRGRVRRRAARRPPDLRACHRHTDSVVLSNSPMC